MEFSLNRDILLKSLNHTQGVVERKSTLQILSNVLIEASSSKIKLTCTDMDIIFIEEINNVQVKKEGSTTTSASVLYEIVRKLNQNSSVNLTLISENKLQLISEKSKFNLNCLPANDFPLTQEDISSNNAGIEANLFLKLLNKTKFAISNDETRHYLNGIYLHKTKILNQIFLTAVATDSHRLSLSNLPLKNDIEFNPIILPKKAIMQLSSLLENSNENIKISNDKSKIKFQLKDSVLISKIIDGKFPDYNQVIPKKNEKILEVNHKEFIMSVDRVISVSSDKKEGVKMNLSENKMNLSVNNPNSGDGMEIINCKFNSKDMNISFNSKYLMDMASQIEADKIIFKFNEPGSPVLAIDPIDKNSLFVLMPMKI